MSMSSRLSAGSGVIVFIMKLLTSALEQPNHIGKPYLFSAEETVAGLSKLAVNDSNKVDLVWMIPYF